MGEEFRFVDVPFPTQWSEVKDVGSFDEFVPRNLQKPATPICLQDYVVDEAGGPHHAAAADEEEETVLSELPDPSEYADDADLSFHHRDSMSYASSEASTAVSRSARRRRGRRAAKAKATSSTSSRLQNVLPILDGPAWEDLMISEDKKVELCDQIESGGRSAAEALDVIKGAVLRMAFEPFGCRLIQLALDAADATTKEAMVREIQGNVLDAISSPHANFVIQKAIEVLPVRSASFIAEELKGHTAEVARHRFGCRILCRLVEHHLSDSSSATELIDEMLQEAEQLIHHNFARHVLELILEHGTAEQKHRIADAIRANLFHNAKNRNASYVVERALVHCDVSDREAIAAELLADSERFLTLATHECGSHVAKAVLTLGGEAARQAKELLEQSAGRVRASKYGKRLMDDI